MSEINNQCFEYYLKPHSGWLTLEITLIMSTALLLADKGKGSRARNRKRAGKRGCGWCGEKFRMQWELGRFYRCFHRGCTYRLPKRASRIRHEVSFLHLDVQLDRTCGRQEGLGRIHERWIGAEKLLSST